MAADSVIKPLDCSVSMLSLAALTTWSLRYLGRGQQVSVEATQHMYVCVCRCGRKERKKEKNVGKIKFDHEKSQTLKLPRVANKVWRLAQTVVGNELAIIQLTLGTPAPLSDHQRG